LSKKTKKAFLCPLCMGCTVWDPSYIHDQCYRQRTTHNVCEVCCKTSRNSSRRGRWSGKSPESWREASVTSLFSAQISVLAVGPAFNAENADILSLHSSSFCTQSTLLYLHLPTFIHHWAFMNFSIRQVAFCPEPCHLSTLIRINDSRLRPR